MRDVVYCNCNIRSHTCNEVKDGKSLVIEHIFARRCLHESAVLGVAVNNRGVADSCLLVTIFRRWEMSLQNIGSSRIDGRERRRSETVLQEHVGLASRGGSCWPPRGMTGMHVARAEEE